MDLNQNIARCIEHANNIGSTVTHNICNGTTQVVPWGSLDWLAMFGIVGFGLALTAMFATIAWDIFR